MFIQIKMNGTWLKFRNYNENAETLKITYEESGN